jgi:Protein of unknown function (DUF3035)
MSGIHPEQPRSARIAAACVVCCTLALMLSSCTEFKRAVGIDPVSPDEFAVESRAPLTIPPDFDLRPPQPGAARPQEKTAAQKAQADLAQAGPGQPGDQTSGVDARMLAIGNGERADPNSEVAPNSLSAKLLDYSGPAATVEQRNTKTLNNIY